MAAPHIRIEGVSKAFGTQHANRNITLDIRPGRILALLGENGAGKSTLMSILSGTLLPDAGRILVNEQLLPPGEPAASLAAGIGMVHQHFLLMDQLSVARNVSLGLPGSFWRLPRRMAALVREVGERFGLPIDPSARIDSLSMGERQRVEILKLLARDCNVLIFDEPTAVLTPGEAATLFDALCGMVAQGKAVVFISHKLPEIMALAGRAPLDVAVLRQGEVMARYDLTVETPTESELIRAMVGREVDLAQVEHLAAEPHPLGEEVLRCTDLRAPGLHGVSLAVRQGEIVALAGVAGNGQKPLVEVLAGVRAPGAGEVRLLGQSWEAFYASDEPGRGLAVIPEDRRGAATAGNLDLLDNLLLTTRRRYTRAMLIDRRQALQDLRQIIDDFSIRPPQPTALAGRLSGGNLQKLVLGREFSRHPGIIVAEQPVQGLDVGATEDVWKRLLDMRAKAGILLVTSDLTEALLLADRILVLYAGRIMGELPRSRTAAEADATRSQIGRWMAGLA
ncbi:ABC transporter ATP-binding protein [Megalodesulfovibrio paquesii]